VATPPRTPEATPPPAAVGSSAAVTIPMGASTLGARAFGASEITVAPGTTVTWRNADTVTHTSTDDRGAWDSGSLAPGQQFSTTLAVAGTFTYHCAIHPGMTGFVVVRWPGVGPSRGGGFDRRERGRAG
jgi:plastocyanin